MNASVWVRVGIFVLGTLSLSLASRASLRDPASHGFYRLFAFIAILALILLNAPVWFRNPFHLPQLLSWLFLILSIILAVGGFANLIRRGRPHGSFENTTVLVNSGLYRYIRHPLYSSLLFLAWGAVLKNLSWASLLLGLSASFFLFAAARAEEAENLSRFGEDYAYYMAHTRRFIPFLF